ncbi:amyloid-beta A4 precursor protein-binding family A member 3 [Colossoma macropomum]|uniref:amyloid-beta A4 precursor protein-binding family A member 3 n=1 Tax=Colossoma macropomum TaxID=42526 RepID=UPI001864359B|nr:amyloid-beta A4 precursor protein-binding family A member 3 [Colossoma macropomum]XP_036442131.1 amyloid-beta A4 precursor protein-binding family A member 3 [Colossoma macropomum]XP_036442132.1 amyloid-beta A4 precursor protein-binding family A member 3 [Colossoma macropomum]
MEKLADIVSSDEVTSFEDELLESSELIPQRTASAKLAVETTDDNYHASTHAGKSLTSPLLEDLDSFNLIEPPPLDWRSDSSSECSLRDIDEPGSSHTDSMEAPLEELSDYGAQNMSFTPAETPSEMEGLTNQEMEMSEPEILENSPEEKPEEERRPRDMDHSHIQTLLTQLQLFHPTPSPKETIHEPEPEQSTSSPDTLTDRHSFLCPEPEGNTYQTCTEGSIASGLLFTESHQRDLLQLLEEPETREPQPVYTAQTTENNIEHVSQLIDPQTRYTAQSVEADEVVSISYGQDTWRSPFQDEFMVSGYSEDELLAQWRQSKGLSPDEIPCHRADVDAEAEAEAQPSYKDVPGPCDPEDLLDGVIFGAKYLGSTQLQSDKNPSTNARMAQAQEAVDRIKAPEGESQPMTEVDLFISTQRIKVLSADTQEAMMDHPLQMISYIADIGSVVVLMARRKPAVHKPSDAAASTSAAPKKCWMICHVFSSDDAQVIAQAIGQAFGVAYQQFLQENGIKAGELRPGEYSDYLGTQELYNGDLVHFSRSENIREVCITKQVGEILGLAVVESGWGSILPTVVVANLLHGGPAERSGELSIGDRIMSVNGTSLVGLPITTCHNIIRDLKSQSQVKLSIVHCPPVTMAIIKRPDPKYQLGFSVEDGIICSLMRGGIAERGGIRVGHRIIEINGQSVVATSHEKIIQILSNAVGEIHLKTMPTSTYRLLTGQEQPVFL